MRILLINQTFYPEQLATSQHVTDFALFLKENGHEVMVLTDRSDYETSTKNYHAHEVYQGVNIYRVRGAMFGKRSFVHRAIDGGVFHLSVFLKLWSLPRPELIISFTSPPLIGVTGTLFAWIQGIRSVQWLMDVNPDAAIEVGYLKRSGIMAKALLAIFNHSLRLSHTIVVLDRWMKEKIVGRGISASKIVVVPPWPVQIAPPKGIDSAAAKKEFGWEGDTVLLYSGNHSIVHPLDTVLQGALAMKDDPTVQMVFAGGGLRRCDVTKFKAQHCLETITQISRQPREALANLLAAADIHLVVLGPDMSGLVHSSKIYGVLLAGKPFIFVGPRKSHVVDLLSEARLGFHVEHGDVAGFLAAVKKIKAFRKEELIAGAVINRAIVERDFTRDYVCQRFLDRLALAPQPISPHVTDYDSKTESLP